MYFKSIKLENFRNYEKEEICFDKKLNLFLGSNAQGKTNLLESLFTMGLGKSFRTNNDKEMISFGKEAARVVSLVGNESGRDTEIEIDYRQDGKIIKLDGVKLSRSIDLLENVYIVVFSPEDLKIIKEGPENRRRFLDRELCQIKPVYYSDLGNYKRILKQRNILLRQHNNDEKLFDVFDESLADYGIRISDEREKFVERLQVISEKIHSDISSGTEKIKISYETKLGNRNIGTKERAEKYRELLKENFEKDQYKGYTGLGPHKDDLRIEVNGTDIRMFGSQGQQRTAALSIKLAEIGLIKQETDSDAILLLDDVLSELDKNRQRYLIESMKNVQVFITATEIEEDLLKLLPHGNSYTVENGSVKLLT